MTDVTNLLYELCEDDRVYDPDFDLVESGILDSFTFIEMLAALEDDGIVIQPTRIDRSRLRTVRGIHALIAEYTTEPSENL